MSACRYQSPPGHAISIRAALARFVSAALDRIAERLKTVSAESRGIARWLRTAFTDDMPGPWLGLMSLVGVSVRSYFLAQPMRYDEAYTFLNFVNGPWYRTFYYPLPNNHVLHTILVRVSVAILGSHPATIRLPAFLAGVCVIPASFLLARRTVGERSGFLTSALVAVFPFLVLYDTMARGYSLLVLLSVWLAILASRFVEDPSMTLGWWISLTVACGLLAMPTFLFPAAGVFTWILVTSLMRKDWARPVRWLLLCALVTAILACLFYTPTIILHRGIQTLVGNSFVEGLPSAEFTDTLPAHVRHTVASFARDIPPTLRIAGLLLFAIGVYDLARRRRWSTLALVPSLGLAGGAFLLIGRWIPYARTWIYALPFAFVFVDAGFVRLTRFAGNYSRGLVLLLAACASVLLMSHNIIGAYPDTGHFPAAPLVVDFLSTRMHQGDRIVAAIPANAPLDFYMWYMGVPGGGPSSGGPRTFFVVQAGRYSLSDLTRHNPPLLLDVSGARVYVLEADPPPER